MCVCVFVCAFQVCPYDEGNAVVTYGCSNQAVSSTHYMYTLHTCMCMRKKAVGG